MSYDYFVKLDRFEGPLDLLLHLIKLHEINIFDIDIFKLTTEYLAYLRLIRFDDLNDAGEFVAMAATLIEIKSRRLLPSEEKANSDEDGTDEDPLRTLQERLLEYETYKKAAEHFSQAPQLGVEIQIAREWERLTPIYEDIEAPYKGDPATLIVLYEQMLQGLAERKVARVEAKTHLVTLEQTIETLDQYVETVRFCLFQSFYNRLASRYDFVIHFMAVLELSKMQKLRVYQQDLLGPLWVYRPDVALEELPGLQLQPLTLDMENAP